MASKKKSTGKDGASKPAKKGAFDVEGALAALGPEALQTPPTLPVDVAILEAERVLEAARQARKKLTALPGFEAEDIDALPAQIAALADAERAWQRGRFAAKEAGGLGKLRREAEELRAALLQAARYFLRKDAAAITEVDRIAEGEGLADLIADLDDLVLFVKAHPGIWAGALGVPADPAARAAELSVALKKGRVDEASLSAQERRNGLFAVLDASLREIRAAARYVFQGDPKRLSTFLSRYEADRKRRQREKAPATPAPDKAPPTP